MNMKGLKSGCRSERGFSLVELMIAMVLGLVVMGAAFAIFMSNQNTYRANEGLNRIQESARAAVEMMSRDIRAAGGSACSNLSTMVTTDASSVNLDRNFVSGSETELTVVSGSELAYAAESVSSNSVTLSADDLDAASDVFDVSDEVVLCDALHTAVATVTGVSGRTVTFSPSVTFHYPVTVMIGRYRSTRWTVGANPRGGSSLYVSRAAGATEEVAEGIRDIRFSYLAPGGAFTTAPADWTGVLAVRNVMTLEAQDAVDGQALSRTVPSVVNLRGRSL